MNADLELEAWRREWRAGDQAIPDLAAKVHRQSRWMRVLVAGDVLVTILAGGATTLWAVVSREPDVVVLAAATWGFLALAWMAGIRSRRGTWAPAAMTTAAFLDISIRRCRGSLAIAGFGAALYFAELAFCLAWIHRRTAHERALVDLLVSPVMLAVWAASVLFVIGVVWFRRKKKAELATLLSLRTGGTWPMDT